ncbi:tRNA-uridine aminocarboxypropyltransferase [Acerihabitans sp. TG2]|uniref:tRNA-uridine aminocarboxypropyltransferase n=1 Tax=Acerihabitans sp. TG2 TaxID=3096008 RepID=UPI002B235EC6|nr:tRNA-uridine aminocarboxypropyltransferase [Acerihabitans sp. TG2]MEA9391431.1 tRNA-uridine aminocarboxypropyltransferase [Acerihabitans sp. TG2]
MKHNAVLALRQHRLDRATRPYRARGCRVLRCEGCLLPQTLCLCDQIIPSQALCRFCLIMFDAEPLKPSNTGRLIADILPDTQAFIWSRTNVDPALLAAIADPTRQPYVVFPAHNAGPNRRVMNHIDINGKPPLFIMLDGTWPEAGKMFRKSPYLAALPILSLDLASVSAYRLRESHGEGHHCTAEVAATLLHQAGDHAAACSLDAYFALFCRRYLAGKSHHNSVQISSAVTTPPV